MKPIGNGRVWGLVGCFCGLTALLAADTIEVAEPNASSDPRLARLSTNYLSPAALLATKDGRRLLIACATANRVMVFDTASSLVAFNIETPEAPLGLALSKDETRLYVACASPSSTICVIDLAQRRIVERIAAGHTAMAPVLSPDEKRLYVCNRFNNNISVIDLAERRELKRIQVEREPTAAAITPDGEYLVVANHLHAGDANHLHLAAKVSVIDTASLEVRKHIPLTLGASLLNGVAISPDGRFAAITHVRSIYWLPTTAVELGRMNGSALSILDLNRLEVLGLVLLDRTGRGAANPWPVAWTPDGKTIIVAHAGTHEISLVDAPLIADPASFFSTRIGDYAPTEKAMAPLPRQHPIRVRKRLALAGRGPRSLTLAGSHLYVANYFSDNLCRIDLTAQELKAESQPLGPVEEPDLARKGEMLFNDAQLCFQGWQSCASCHDTDGRTDALNWDLLNDGIANPKNTRSLLWAHRTGPAMALGVRTNAAAAVRAGLHHILFSEQPEEVAEAMDAYLQTLRPVRSPNRVNGVLSPAAKRGEQLFFNADIGCANCHPPPFYTDKAGHDVGTATSYRSMYALSGQDQPTDRFFSPTLAELWRSGPYLHDGSAETLREVLTTKNPQDRHGRTSHLTPPEIDDLVAYLLSL